MFFSPLAGVSKLSPLSDTWISLVLKTTATTSNEPLSARKVAREPYVFRKCGCCRVHVQNRRLGKDMTRISLSALVISKIDIEDLDVFFSLRWRVSRNTLPPMKCPVIVF